MVNVEKVKDILGDEFKFFFEVVNTQLERLQLDNNVRVLDVGTGTGILCIHAAQLGAKYALGLDNDVEAIEVAQENLVINGVQDKVQLLCGDVHDLQGSFDLIVSNIQSSILTPMLPTFAHLLIEEGHLFIAQPPLYKITQKNKTEYAYTEAERAEIVKSFGRSTAKVNLSRYKGLGEMNALQLWDTTMDPANRTLLQVTIEDAAAADRTFDMLMGAAVPPRKRFIQTHAHEVRNLDI